MIITSIVQEERGFTLVQAIFVLVVLGLLGGVMMRLASVQSSTSILAVQGARAYQAARSGAEWGAVQASNGASCNGTMSFDGFAVTTTCTSESYVEGSTTVTVYQMTSVAVFGIYGSSDFVSRTVKLKVAL